MDKIHLGKEKKETFSRGKSFFLLFYFVFAQKQRLRQELGCMSFAGGWGGGNPGKEEKPR